MAKWHAMVRHYGEQSQSMGTFKTKKAADAYCNEQYVIAQGYNKSFGVVNGTRTIFSSDGEGFSKTVFFVQKD